MDGLLIDSERQMYCKVGMEVSKELGKPISEHFLTTLMGGSWDNYKNSILKEYGYDYPYDEYIKRYWGKINYIIENVGIPLRPGVKDVLDYCKNNSIHIAVATSSSKRIAHSCLHNSNIEDYIEYIVTSEDVKETKPNPEIFLKAIQHFDIDINEALVFEDGHNGALAAKNGNCRLVLVEDLAYLDDDDKKYALLHTDNIIDVIDLIRKENERTISV